MEKSNGYLSLSIIAFIIAIAYAVAMPQIVNHFKKVFGYVELSNCMTDTECENAEVKISQLNEGK